MAQPISAIQIRNAEMQLQAKMKADPKVAEKVRAGRIKWVVVPGENMSRLVGIDMDNPDDVKEFGGNQMFASPQEAEHFTAGFGNEPTNPDFFGNIASSAVIPMTQYHSKDPLRVGESGPQAGSKSGDIMQDIIHGYRYASPIIGSALKTKLPVAALFSGMSTAGTGLLNRGIAKDIRDGRELYAETLPNIIGAGLISAGGVAADRYFKPENIARRNLEKKVALKLALPIEEVRAQGIVPRIEDPLRHPAMDKSPYTYEMYNTQPITDFTAKVPNETPMVMQASPKPRVPTKNAEYVTTMPIRGNKMPDYTKDRWYMVARDYLKQLGIPENQFNLDDVVDHIKKVHFSKRSNMAMIFNPQPNDPPFTKGQWAAMRAQTRDTQPFTHEMLDRQAGFKDPQTTKDWREARDEMRKRYARHGISDGDTKIISPEQYENMKGIELPSFTKTLGVRNRFSIPAPLIRWPIRAATLAASALLPYGIQQFNKRGDKK